jgi:hypothetical protein
MDGEPIGSTGAGGNAGAAREQRPVVFARPDSISIASKHSNRKRQKSKKKSPNYGCNIGTVKETHPV